MSDKRFLKAPVRNSNLRNTFKKNRSSAILCFRKYAVPIVANDPNNVLRDASNGAYAYDVRLLNDETIERGRQTNESKKR